MHQIPAFIWNEIAATQPLTTDAATQAFTLSEPAMTQMTEAWENAFPGEPNKVALAIPMVFPLLTEREAIRSYLSADPERLGLAQALPEVNSAEEAAQLAARELSMSPELAHRLHDLLLTNRPMIGWLTALDSIGERPRPPARKTMPTPEDFWRAQKAKPGFALREKRAQTFLRYTKLDESMMPKPRQSSSPPEPI
jgi:hypothetical protein